MKAGDFSGFEDLADINLKQNGISELPVGIFYQLPSKKKLKDQINLSENLLSRLEARSFYGISFLVLHLDKNRIKVIDDEAFSNLNFTLLNLNFNELTSFNPTVFKNVVVEDDGILSLRGNKLNRITSYNFANLRNSDDQPARLHSLLLDTNLISQIDNQAFAGMRIDSLTLQENLIAALTPESFAKLSVLELNISHNRLAALPDRVFAQLEHAHERPTTIDLSFNQIAGLNDLTFDGVTRIRYLDLSYNQVTSVPPALIKLVQTGRISRMKLTGNPLNQEWKDYLRRMLGSAVEL